MQSLKRKTPPSWASASASPGPSTVRATPVKVEEGEEMKRRRAGQPILTFVYESRSTTA
jgi:hypothetical protein